MDAKGVSPGGHEPTHGVDGADAAPRSPAGGPQPQTDTERAEALLETCELMTFNHTSRSMLPDGTEGSQMDFIALAVRLAPELDGVRSIQKVYDLKKAHPEMSLTERCKRVIAAVPAHCVAYASLAGGMEGHEVTLLDGRVMTKAALLKHAIHLNAGYAAAYTQLAWLLGSLETGTTLADGTHMRQEALFLRGIALQPKNSYCYYHFALKLPPTRKTTLEDGTTLSKMDLIKHALALYPRRQEARRALANLLSIGESTTMHDGTVLTREELCGEPPAAQPTKKRRSKESSGDCGCC